MCLYQARSRSNGGGERGGGGEATEGAGAGASRCGAREARGAVRCGGGGGEGGRVTPHRLPSTQNGPQEVAGNINQRRELINRVHAGSTRTQEGKQGGGGGGGDNDDSEKDANRT